MVADAGSTKFALCDALKGAPHAQTVCGNAPDVGNRIQRPRSRRAVGRLQAGPVLFVKKKRAVKPPYQLVENIYRAVNMHIIYMEAASHDIHAAYVSHISHITSFALANTVLEKEKRRRCHF